MTSRILDNAWRSGGHCADMATCGRNSHGLTQHWCMCPQHVGHVLFCLGNRDIAQKVPKVQKNKPCKTWTLEWRMSHDAKPCNSSLEQDIKVWIPCRRRLWQQGQATPVTFASRFHGLKDFLNLVDGWVSLSTLLTWLWSCVHQVKLRGAKKRNIGKLKSLEGYWIKTHVTMK